MRDAAFHKFYVVDDEPALCQLIEVVLLEAGFSVDVYATGDAFLEAQAELEPGGVILDVRMPGLGGLEVLKRLRKTWPDAPVIMISGHGDIPTAVTAMQAGAVDFLEKPFRNSALKEIAERVASRKTSTEPAASANQAQVKLARLTKRELDVLRLLVRGDQNKIAASKLAISPRTVEVHRARIMQKLDVASFAEMVRVSVEAELDA